MNNRKLQEFKDDIEADKAVGSVSPSLTKLASAITNAKDFGKVVEALMKWLKNKKGSQLSSLESNQNYKMVLNYLNKMQSDTEDATKKPEQSIVKK